MIKMKRLLCIVGGMDAGGAETFLMKIYRKLDKKYYQMDFYVLKDNAGFYDQEIIELGGKIFHGTAKSQGFFKYVHTLKKTVQENHYNYVLRMSQNSLSALDLTIAKNAGAKRVTFRSTNSHVYGGKSEHIIHCLFRPIANKIIDVKIAPSKEAAVFMFGKKNVRKDNVSILNNSLDLDVYRFRPEKRDCIRQELGVEEKLVIGHIGRFNKQKNHNFLIKIFKEILKKHKNSTLLLLGSGECEKEIKDTICRDGLNEKVLFLGVKHNTPDYYSAMDFFVFPSLYEGMPNTVIEAQACGLPCLVSDTITKDVQITNNLQFASLSRDASFWADHILKNYFAEYKRDIKDIKPWFQAKGFVIENAVAEFTKIVFDE